MFNQINKSDYENEEIMLRKIVNINEELCDGCGDCVPNCQEGALQIIDGKARLISDLFCDGLGACLGHCPQAAITIDVREAEPYNETKVMEYIIRGGENVIKAHLNHLLEHNESEYYTEAISYLESNGINIRVDEIRKVQESHCSCPGSAEHVIGKSEDEDLQTGKRESQLRQWPIQMHLISPNAGYYRNSNLLLAADCVAFSYADFHKDFLKGKSVAIACPKLDSNKQVYLDKLVAMITQSQIQSITVMIMQVPCCGGLLQLAQQAVDISGIDIPLKAIVIGINGEILQEM